jgi:hypothetical protein
MMSPWYRQIFRTRLAPHRHAVQEFITTRQGYRLATSTGGVLTGRGADIIVIDDPLKPEEALSEAQRQAANEWYDHTLYSRLNDKRYGAIVIVMQRLHEDDLVGHVLGQEQWEVVSFPAIAETDEEHQIETIWEARCFTRRQGEPLHPDREPLDTLDRIRRTIGEYNFAGQYQQSPAPLGGGLVKAEWFKRYRENERPERFDRIVQSCVDVAVICAHYVVSLEIELLPTWPPNLGACPARPVSWPGMRTLRPSGAQPRSA